MSYQIMTTGHQVNLTESLQITFNHGEYVGIVKNYLAVRKSSVRSK
jgi:hypothetical protein